MKIMLLLSSLNAGGAERVGATLANAWAEQGHEVILVPTFSKGNGESFYPIEQKVRVHWLSQDLPQNKLLSRVFKPWYLRRLMKAEQADVMVSFLTNVNIMSIAANLGLGIPLIVSERSHPLYQKISSNLKTMRKHLYPRADVVMVQTQEAAQDLKKILPLLKDVVVMPNPLPAELVKEAPNTQAPKRVVAMGRLVASKQFDLLIHLFSQASKQMPDWTLHIYGDGSEREKLNSLIKSLNKTECIFLEGKTDRPWAQMRQAQVFAMTSKLEGFPNVMLEAMAVGLPVVAFDCPSGPRDISANGERAKLIPLGQDKLFGKALSQLMSDAALRENLAQAGQDYVFTHYHQAQVLQQWDVLLQRVTQKNKHPLGKKG